MSDKFAIIGEENLASGTPLQILRLEADTGNRAKFYEFTVSTEGTMDDQAATVDVSRCTTAGADTAVTPRPIDPLGPASAHSAGSNGGTLSTVTVNSELFKQAVHLRAIFRWVAVPGGELMLNITANHGLVIRASAVSSTELIRSTAHFEE